MELKFNYEFNAQITFEQDFINALYLKCNDVYDVLNFLIFDSIVVERENNKGFMFGYISSIDFETQTVIFKSLSIGG